eukprot:jgi/Botrbrau1/6498/Bobra.0034s0071.1
MVVHNLPIDVGRRRGVTRSIGCLIGVRLVWWVMNTTLSFPVRLCSRSGIVISILVVPPFGRFVSFSGNLSFRLWLTSSLTVFRFGLRFFLGPCSLLGFFGFVSD